MSNSSTPKPLRIGIIGAGRNTRERHIPGLLACPGVEIAAVANRSLDSARRVQEEFPAIARVCADPREIIAEPLIDAIVIGTWPDQHEPLSVAALAAGKHVLCEARMARDLAEARRMLAAHRARPDLIAQVVPSPFTLPFDRTILECIQSGCLGQILSASLRFNEASFIDSSSPMTFRQNIALSGCNTMTLGIFYEAMARWLGHASTVCAQGLIHTASRVWEGKLLPVEVPEYLDVIARLHNGAQLSMQLSSFAGLAENNKEIWIHGTEGTLHLDLQRQLLRYGSRHQPLAALELMTDEHSAWRVEASFIGAIRGQEEVRLTSFTEACRYMAFTEAVSRSCHEHRHITIEA